MKDFEKLYADVKKCPFCGGEASLTVRIALDEYIAQYHCKDCRAAGQSSYLHLKRDSAVEEAKEFWNRRVGEDGK